MADHTARGHALLSPSAAHRWMVCTPSAQLEATFADTTSSAAAEGTLAHEICEIKARQKFFKKTDLGFMAKNVATRELNKLRKDPLYQDEMEGFTDDYVEELDVQSLSFSERPHIALETRLDLTEWIPEGFGTADCIMIGGNKLLIADFKYGKGVKVSAENNPQMQIYALGALKKFSMIYQIDRVVMMILQPRLSVNPEIWEESVEDLLDFGESVKGLAQMAMAGEGEYVPGEEQCRFCRARETCRARADHNIQMAFGPAGKMPPLITDEEVGEYLRKGADVEKWLKDLQAYALRSCLDGKEIPGYKAVEGRGSRDWTDQDAAFKQLQKSGVPEAVMYERKPLTLAALEKVVGKKAFAEAVGEYIVKKPGKPALVPESDERPAITSIDEAFREVRPEDELPFC